MFEANTFRRLCKIIIALVLVFSINDYFFKTLLVWSGPAVIFVMLTPTGSALYQGVLRLLLISVILLLSPYFFSSFYQWGLPVNKIILSALLGIICNVIILPDQVHTQFSRAIVPIIKAYADYFASIMNLLLRKDAQAADLAKFRVESTLEKLPQWIFARGFDLALQEGYRHFFLEIEKISEIFFAMHHLARYEFDKDLLAKIRKPLLKCVKKSDKFFHAIVTLLEIKQLKAEVDDFYIEIKKIEKIFKKNVFLSLQLEIIEKDPVYLAEFIFDLKNLHNTLLGLAASLRK